MPNKVLIVDDEAKQIFKEILEDEGFRVLLADNGLEALTLVEKEKPEVIVLDLLMPNMGGEEFLRVMKDGGHLDSVRIIVTTGFNDFGITRERICKEYPVDSFLDKPINNVELIRKVRESLARKGEGQ